MQSRNDQRLIPNGLNLGPVAGNAYGHATVQYGMPGQVYGQSIMKENGLQHGTPANTMNDLAQAFAGANLQGFGSVGSGKGGNQSMSATPVNVAAMTGAHANNHMYYTLPDGRVLLSNLGTSQGGYPQLPGAYSVAPAQAQYLQQASYQVSQPMPGTPQGQNWISGRQVSTELPELSAPRRTSWSSNEEAAGPRTPFFGHSQVDYQPKVAALGQSPDSWGTPSPIGQNSYPQQLAKTSNGQYTYLDLDALCHQNPTIPRPVPAIFSGEQGRGTLEKSLQNQMNTTNVYIRGLPPNTTDGMLYNYGVRFGDIVSAKSMLDQNTGLCKGFGFIKYHNFVDGENCIRGFFHWGYEAKWARVSHNEKLKTLGDPENTNLYVSNLPSDMNEFGLKNIFMDYNVLSCKILRDPNGHSRGVGFARFESPEKCNEIIQNFTGQPVGDKGATLNIRYADTEEQKRLKTSTAEKRQFKTNEYNTAVWGPSSPYNVHSPLAASFPSPLPLQTVIPGSNGFWAPPSPLAALYQPQYQVPLTFPHQAMPMIPNVKPLAENIASVLPAAKPAAEKTTPVSPATMTFAENIAPASSRFTSRIQIGSPTYNGFAKKPTGEESQASSPSVESIARGCNGGDYYNELSASEASAPPSPPSHTVNVKGKVDT